MNKSPYGHNVCPACGGWVEENGCICSTTKEEDMTNPDNTNAEFDAIAASFFNETETPSLAEAVDALMAVNEKLMARCMAYEASAKDARHAFRNLRKATTKAEAVEAITSVRTNLRAIHPETSI